MKQNATILALVGMPGAGKSEAVAYLEQKGIPFVRFGDVTDEGVKAVGLPLTSENERNFRENIRQRLGMAAYAIRSEAKIAELASSSPLIAIDGLYSWEEYVYLKKIFPNLLLIQIYAYPQTRYSRLEKRPIRPVERSYARARDIAEIEKLNKGGPIAMADFIVENNSEKLEELYRKLDTILAQIKGEKGA